VVIQAPPRHAIVTLHARYLVFLLQSEETSLRRRKVVRTEGHCLPHFFSVQSKSLKTRLLLLSFLGRSPARLCLSRIDDPFGSFQRTYGRIKSRHVSGIIFD